MPLPPVLSTFGFDEWGNPLWGASFTAPGGGGILPGTPQQLVPITGGILQNKDVGPAAYTPILLVSIVFTNGIKLNVCSKQGDAQGQLLYLTYQGTQFQSRVVAQNLQAVAAMQANGLDVYPAIQIALADSDGIMWQYELIYGFLGARITLQLVLADLRSGTFTDDSRTIFSGICDPVNLTENDNPQLESLESTVIITANSDYTFTKHLMPELPCERRCFRDFPVNKADRQANIVSFSSFPIIETKCLYAADIPAGLGNLQSDGTAFLTCGLTKADCKARGMYDKDSHGRTTANFTGSTYNTPALWRSKSYLAGKTLTGVNNANLQALSQHFPETYGATWVNNPIPLVTYGDGNSTRWDVAVCAGYIDSPQLDAATIGINKVEVNGILVPRVGDPGWDPLFSWQVVSTGSVFGSFNLLPGFTDSNHKPLGDPFGGIARIVVTVFSQLADSNSLPTIRVLVGDAQNKSGLNGREILELSDLSGHFQFIRTDNPASCILDILRRNGIDIQKRVDIGSYLATRSFCAGMINYTASYADSNGNFPTLQHRRWGVSLALEATTQYQVGTLLQRLRISNNIYLWQSAVTGLIKFQPKAGLADSQPNPVPGSNTVQPIVSWKVTDDPTTLNPTGIGYSAYDFDETNTIRGSFRMFQNPISQSPNILKAQIVDEDFDHIQDSLTFGDPTASKRSGQNVNGIMNIIACPNVDQAARAAATYMAEGFRLNPRQDAGGSIGIEFETTHIAAHLDVGMIIRFSDTLRQFTMRPFRVISIAPRADFETVVIRCLWHDDRIYCDGYAKIDPYGLIDGGDVYGPRNPYPWHPNGPGNYALDALFAAYPPNSVRTFSIDRGVGYDPNSAALVPEIIIGGESPVNTSGTIPPPFMQRYATITSQVSGSIPSNTFLYVFMSCLDGQGQEGPLTRFPSTAFVASSTNTNTVTIQVYSYPAGVAGCRVYAGQTADQISLYQSFPNSAPPIITINTLPTVNNQGPIDIHEKKLVTRVKKLIIPGAAVFGPRIDNRTGVVTENVVGANFITFAFGYDIYDQASDFVATDHSYDGMVMMCVGIDVQDVTETETDVPFFTLNIQQNIGNTFFFSNAPDLTLDGPGAPSPGKSNTAACFYIVLNKIMQYTNITPINTIGVPMLTMRIPYQGNSLVTSFQGIPPSITALPGYIGCAARIIEGPGKGTDPVHVTGPLFPPSQGDITLTLDAPFAVAPVPGQSIVIFEEITWRYSNTVDINNIVRGRQLKFGCELPNVATSVYYVEVMSEDVDGTMPVRPNANPYRLFWWEGQFSPTDLFSNGLNLISNPGFEIAARTPTDTATVADWFLDINAVFDAANPNNPGVVLSNPYSIGQDDNPYSGHVSLHVKLHGTGEAPGYNPIIPPGGTAEIHVAHRHSFNCKPGDTFYEEVVVSTLVNTSLLPVGLPGDAGPVHDESIFLYVNYTDGTKESFFSQNKSASLNPNWFIKSQTITVSATKTPSHVTMALYVSIRNFRSTPYAIPPNMYDVWFDNAKMVKAINLNTDAFGSSLSGLNAQGSIIPTQNLITTTTVNTNGG